MARAVVRGLGGCGEAELQRRGAVKINLQVRSTNTQVIAFYESLGYSVEERVSMGKRVE